MAFISRLKLLAAECRLYYGAFGTYNRYRCWCLKKNAKTVAEKLGVVKEVLEAAGVNSMEAQYNELYVRRHRDSGEPEDKTRSVPPRRSVGTALRKILPKRWTLVERSNGKPVRHAGD